MVRRTSTEGDTTLNRAAAIRALRETRQETQAEFAAVVGTRRETVSAWENGQPVGLSFGATLVSLGLDVAYVLPTAPAATSAPADSSERGAA